MSLSAVDLAVLNQPKSQGRGGASLTDGGARTDASSHRTRELAARQKGTWRDRIRIATVRRRDVCHKGEAVKRAPSALNCEHEKGRLAAASENLIGDAYFAWKSREMLSFRPAMPNLPPANSTLAESSSLCAPRGGG